MKNLLLVLFILIVDSKSFAQITIIPDFRFERVLVDLGIDSDHTINGQILNSDALTVTELNLSPAAIPNYPYEANDFYDGLIHDLSGIEGFINLEHLVVNTTMIDHLNLDSLIKLKYLNCVDNMLTTVNVSNNPLLEYINITSEGDVLPINDINEIDLSNNPNINTLIASGVARINLHNNNNLQNMIINVSCSYCWDFPPDFIVGNVCINVDNVPLAQSNQYPYSEWDVNHSYRNIYYSNDLSQCSLGISNFKNDTVGIYPNPVKSGILYFNGNQIHNIKIYDLLGRRILTAHDVIANIDISNLEKGNYIIEIITGKATQTEKLIVE